LSDENNQIHCQDCRHWDKTLNIQIAPATEIPDGHGACRRTGTTAGETHEKDTLAFALDYEEYSANLITSPEYGCVMAEPIV
jgi:hypothetical protein